MRQKQINIFWPDIQVIKFYFKTFHVETRCVWKFIMAYIRHYLSLHVGNCSNWAKICHFSNIIISSYTTFLGQNIMGNSNFRLNMVHFQPFFSIKSKCFGLIVYLNDKSLHEMLWTFPCEGTMVRSLSWCHLSSHVWAFFVNLRFGKSFLYRDIKINLFE